MKIKSAALALSVLAAQPAYAAASDCPLRDAAFSADSPMVDVMLSDAAKAVVEQHMPGTFAKLPPIMASTKAPTFAAILSVRQLAMFGSTKPGVMEAIDAELRKLPVTAADKIARCERYDNDTVRFPAAGKGQLRVLLFEKMTGFRDTPSVEAAKAMMVAMAARKGWALAVTDKGGAINAKTLKQFDVVVWNNVSGDVLTPTQRKAFEGWMAKGGGFVGMHGTGGDPVYFWDWYADKLLGARFTGHPSEPQFQDATVRMEKSPSGIGASLAASFTLNDEWYSFAKSPRASGANVIATLDETTYSRKGRFGGNLDMGADHPIAWTRCVNNGRSFYSAIGHRPEIYAAPENMRLLEDGILWASGKGGSTCRKGKEVTASPE